MLTLACLQPLTYHPTSSALLVSPLAVAATGCPSVSTHRLLLLPHLIFYGKQVRKRGARSTICKLFNQSN
jgi:hypothetical protein